MNGNLSSETYSLSDLNWDTDFFGVTCGNLILKEKIREEDWSFISQKIKDYEFVVIKNINSNYNNSKILGENTKSFLIDVNIQFVKDVSENLSEEELFILDKENDLTNQLFSIANFNQSRFIEDEKLLELGGENVYKEWIQNSFDNPGKNIIVIKNELETVLGFVLVSKRKEQLVIELIAVNRNEKSKGIGTILVRKAEIYAKRHNLKQIRVGTQVTNIAAMNFYNKMNFKQSEVHQVFHLWNS